jgi:hypothetical protein
VNADMAKKKSSAKRKRTAVSKRRGRVSKAGPSLQRPRNASGYPDIAADARGIRGQVVAHVQGALRSLLGHALNQMDEWQGFDGHQDVALLTTGRSQQPPSASDPVPAPAATPVKLDPGLETPSSSAPEALVTEQDLAAAKALLRKLRQMARMARGGFSAMFYLEELGALKAFDGRTTDMNKLSGKNLSTTRKRILELIREQAVCKASKSSKIQKISLTNTGKQAYFLHMAAAEDSGPN